MNPLLILALVASGAWVMLSKKSTSESTSKTTSVTTPAGSVTITTASPQPTASTASSESIPPIKVTLPTADDLSSAQTSSGSLDPMLSESEQYAIANYSNDALYNEALSSGHLAYVAAAATKLASAGDTRAADLTLRVANWGK